MEEDVKLPENNDINTLCKEDLLGILDRIINFIHGCDNKTSIILGIFGALGAIFLTSDGIIIFQKRIEEIYNVSQCIGNAYLYLLYFLMLCLIIGLSSFIMVLFPRTKSKIKKDTELKQDSVIFFKSISMNQDYESYKIKLINTNEKEYIDDIKSQIYINSYICNKKYIYFKVGLIISYSVLILFTLYWVLTYFCI